MMTLHTQIIGQYKPTNWLNVSALVFNGSAARESKCDTGVGV